MRCRGITVARRAVCIGRAGRSPPDQGGRTGPAAARSVGGKNVASVKGLSGTNLAKKRGGKRARRPWLHERCVSRFADAESVRAGSFVRAGPLPGIYLRRVRWSRARRSEGYCSGQGRSSHHKRGKSLPSQMAQMVSKSQPGNESDCFICASVRGTPAVSTISSSAGSDK